MTSRLEETRRRFEDHKLKFEKLRADVNIKLKFLEENKVLPSCSSLAQYSVCAYILLQHVCVCILDVCVCVCMYVCVCVCRMNSLPSPVNPMWRVPWEIRRHGCMNADLD